MGKRRISRRQFLEGTGTALTVAVAAPALNAQRIDCLNAAARNEAPDFQLALEIVPNPHDGVAELVRLGYHGLVFRASTFAPAAISKTCCAFY